MISLDKDDIRAFFDSYDLFCEEMIGERWKKNLPIKELSEKAVTITLNLMKIKGDK